MKAWGEAASAAAKGFQDAVKDVSCVFWVDCSVHGSETTAPDATAVVPATLSQVKDGVYGVDWAALGATGEKLLCAGSGAAYVGPVFALMAFALKQWSAFEQVEGFCAGAFESTHLNAQLQGSIWRCCVVCSCVTTQLGEIPLAHMCSATGAVRGFCAHAVLP